MKPKPNTLQAIFPLASEGEINAVVRLIDEFVIGDATPKAEQAAARGLQHFTEMYLAQEQLQREQRTRLYALKGEK